MSFPGKLVSIWIFTKIFALFLRSGQVCLPPCHHGMWRQFNKNVQKNSPKIINYPQKIRKNAKFTKNPQTCAENFQNPQVCGEIRKSGNIAQLRGLQQAKAVWKVFSEFIIWFLSWLSGYSFGGHSLTSDSPGHGNVLSLMLSDQIVASCFKSWVLICAEYAEFGYHEVFSRPHSPDPSLYDYDLNVKLKGPISKIHFSNLEELLARVTQEIWRLNGTWVLDGADMLSTYWQVCWFERRLYWRVEMKISVENKFF